MLNLILCAKNRQRVVGRPFSAVKLLVRNLFLTMFISQYFFGQAVFAFDFSFDLEELPSPPNTRLSWVGKKIVQNGMPMQIVEIESNLEALELQMFYQESWRELHAEGERADIVRQVGDWNMVSTILENHNVVVQFKQSASGLTGFISATPLDHILQENTITQYFPRQWGTELVSSTESDDNGSLATTLILKNTYSIGSNQSFYESSLLGNGWSLQHTSFKDETAVMFFGRSSGALELAMRKDKGHTLIFVNVRGEDI